MTILIHWPFLASILAFEDGAWEVGSSVFLFLQELACLNLTVPFMPESLGPPRFASGGLSRLSVVAWSVVSQLSPRVPGDENTGHCVKCPCGQNGSLSVFLHPLYNWMHLLTVLILEPSKISHYSELETQGLTLVQYLTCSLTRD